MNELMDKVDILIKEIDNIECVSKIKKLNNIILDDDKLIKLIEEYKINRKDEIKNKIIKNKKFIEYKKYETDINLLIMEINSRLKEINNKGKCC